MKLQKKHLVGYLPYGLKYKDIPKGYDGIRKLDIKTFDWCLEYGKPILRPLSDLIINENTCDEINEVLEPNGLEINNFFLLKNSLNSVAISWEEMQEVLNILYREHYDIYGLIGLGLAIDINKI
jgi:hypothetical protein